MTLQEEIDAIVYPPTHTYKLEGLVPTGPLSRRIEVIQEEFPGFFSSGTLLDVGCNKGYFSLYHAGKVVGIDPDEACIQLCKKLVPTGDFIQTTFGGLLIDKMFDKIFIGNGHHYPFIEADGWSWVEKLAEMSDGLVLIEGPIDMKGVDAQRCIPKHLAHEFNYANLLSAFDKFFYPIKVVRSPLVLRWFLLFGRRESS
jgi:SAM-dependent methyltransferase